MTKNFFEIQNCYFTESETNKVNNVNLTIERQGQIISLLGPSGIGKTTILRTIAGLQKLSTGKIKLRNKITKSFFNCFFCLVNQVFFPKTYIFTHKYFSFITTNMSSLTNTFL